MCRKLCTGWRSRGWTRSIQLLVRWGVLQVWWLLVAPGELHDRQLASLRGRLVGEDILGKRTIRRHAPFQTGTPFGTRANMAEVQAAVTTLYAMSSNPSGWQSMQPVPCCGLGLVLGREQTPSNRLMAVLLALRRTITTAGQPEGQQATIAVSAGSPSALDDKHLSNKYTRLRLCSRPAHCSHPNA